MKVAQTLLSVLRRALSRHEQAQTRCATSRSGAVAPKGRLKLARHGGRQRRPECRVRRGKELKSRRDDRGFRTLFAESIYRRNRFRFYFSGSILCTAIVFVSVFSTPVTFTFMPAFWFAKS